MRITRAPNRAIWRPDLPQPVLVPGAQIGGYRVPRDREAVTVCNETSAPGRAGQVQD